MSSSSQELLTAISTTSIPKIINLLNDGVDVNQSDIAGATALHFAVMFNNEQIVKLLLKQKGIQVNRVTNYYCESTPLYNAIMFGKTDIAKLLIDDDRVNINACGPDPDAQSALLWAVQFNRKEVVKHLLSKD